MLQSGTRERAMCLSVQMSEKRIRTQDRALVFLPGVAVRGGLELGGCVEQKL